MYDLITLQALKDHDYYGWIGTKCTECDDQFYADSKIYNLMESNIYLCHSCYSEVAYTESVQKIT